MKNLIPTFSFLFLTVFQLHGAVIYNNERGRTGPIFPTDIPIRNDFDVNGDGTVDLTLDATVRPTEFTFWADGQDSGGVITITNIERGQFGVAPLPKDFEIGPILGDPALEFTLLSTHSPLPIVSSTPPSRPDDPFYRNPGYLGFQFEASDGIHYGYIYLEEVDSLVAIYHGFAYESEPNTPILAGAKQAVKQWQWIGLGRQRLHSA